MSETAWYLGLDAGMCHWRAVWSNGDRAVSWQDAEAKPEFPAVAYLDVRETSGTRFPLGEAALAAMDRKEGVLLDRFKPYLQATIPFYDRSGQRWEPRLQMYGQPQVSLYWLQRVIQALLEALKPGVGDETPEAVLKAQAAQNLAGAIVSCPAGVNDAYRFNWREGLLRSRTVSSSDRVYFLEEAIAALLGWSGEAPQPGLTLILHAGGATTELALVDLPSHWQRLSRDRFSLRSFAYAGEGIVEDIFYQLLYPQWLSQPGFLQKLDLTIPQGGCPDAPQRDIARSQLRSFAGGWRLLETAKRVWPILQKQEVLQSTLGDLTWCVQKQDFDRYVVKPYVEALNGEVNRLLSQRGLPSQAITQVLISGKTGLALAQELQAWLTLKCDTVRCLRAEQPEMQVARGLSRLPQYPQLLDAIAHQYSDYFLLRELLEVLPNRKISTAEVMQRLERRGINTRPVRDRLLTWLRGTLPSGLIPTTDRPAWLAITSQQNRDYQSITAAPLGQEEGDEYHINTKQRQRLLEYINALVASSEQNLTEPLSNHLVLADWEEE
ncbi:MAG: hypothetical protein ACLFT0_07285 [Spirulinaceae cyanobacterium]